MEQLLQRYIRGEVSEEERLKVASWLDESPENMREFLALRKLYDLSLWQSDTNEKETFLNTKNNYRALKDRSHLFGWFLG